MPRKNKWKVVCAYHVGPGRPIEMFTSMRNLAVKAIVDARQHQCNAQVRRKRGGDVAIELEMPVDIVTTMLASGEWAWNWFGVRHPFRPPRGTK